MKSFPLTMRWLALTQIRVVKTTSFIEAYRLGSRWFFSYGITSASLREHGSRDEKVPHLSSPCVLHVHCSKYRTRLWRSHPPSDGMSLVILLTSWPGGKHQLIVNLSSLHLTRDGRNQTMTPQAAIEYFTLLAAHGVDHAIFSLANVSDLEPFEVLTTIIVPEVSRLSVAGR